MNFRLTIAALLIATGAGLANWPQFRGTDGAGVADVKGLPTNFSPTENVKWKVDLPGRSVASPVVFGNRLFITAASGPRFDRLHVVCLDADTGKKLWHRQLTATGNTACHPKSSMAAPTPCVNADGIYCLFATADLAAFDLDGNLKWYRSLVTDYPNISNQVGMAASPILWKDFLIVPMDTVGDSFLAAVDTKYGKNVWKVERPKDINWVTPTLRTIGDKAEVLFTSPKENVAYDAADGKKAWSVPGGGAQVPTAILHGDRVLLPTRDGLACLKPNGKGMTEVWKQPKLSSGYTSPLLYQDRVYALRGGLLNCADVKTGKELWSERVGRGKGQFWASPVAADGKVYTFDDNGVCAVVQAGDEARVLATNDMKGEIMGTPAIARGALYIPTTTALYCIAASK